MSRQAEIKAAEAIFAEHLAGMKPGDFAVDCGANVGRVTEQLAQTGAHVEAFEPDPVVFESLRKACSGFSNVTLLQAAAGVETGEAELLRSPYFDEDPLKESEKNTICAEAVTGRKEGGWQPMDRANAVKVPVVDLPAYLEEKIARHGRIAVLKLDIEGMEVPILNEMDQRGLFAGIGLTVAELHPWRFPDQAAEIKAMRETFGARYPLTKVNLNWG
ncbi:FkbM family methyltransferase [Leisingera sp. NJS201]|uniref:FkbM family methyltransferase n=2 Tax=unclassified Leisingera TaxID=2614906 RepID=UPI0014306A90|nr:FkbM family methyltransferase [Leisingera sp. NJS201]